MIIPQNRLYSGARLSFTKSLFHTLLSILILTSTFSSTSISASTSPSPSISASASPSSSVPTNILLFIGDGMGFEQVAAAGMVAHGAAGTLSFEAMPFQGAVTTRSSNNLVTDSAAAATSLATGFKVNNGVLSQAIPGDNRELQTLLEHLKMQGKSTGLVTTTNLTHATPAAFGAHESSRGNTTQIAADYLGQTRPLVLMGGGGYGLSASAADAAGYTVVTNTVGLQALDTEAAGLVAGLFGTGNLPYEFDGLGSLPHLSQMTEAALAILDNDPDGFFLMVEGGRIDHAGHANDLQRNISETLEFAHSVQVGLDWASGRDDTLIVVTADHETGGLSVLANNGQGNLPTVTWSTGGHTGQQVPVYAWGVNADRFAGTLDNTQFRNRMLGLSDFGDCAVDRHIDAGDFSALVLEVFDGDGSDPESVAGGSFPGDPEGCNPNRDLAIDAGDMSCLVRTVFEGPGLCENSLAAGPAVAGQETGLNWGNWVTGLNGVEHSVVDSSGGAGLLTGTDADPVGAGLLTGPDVRDDGAGFLTGTARAQLSIPTQSPLAPALSIPLQIPANAGDTVAVPITFMPDSSGISTLFFSVDYDQTWLSFDPTDADLDGIPDNISFSIPPAFFPGVTFDPGDIDGELDIAIADFLPPLGSLPGGVVATITFGVGFPVWPTEARVSFSSDPPPSFGTVGGQSIPGLTSGGSVLIQGSPGIGGIVWHDTDSDGVQDLGEPGIPGVWIDLVEAGPDELFDTADDLTFDPWRSDEVGLYAFGGLPAGLYRVDADETGAALAARTLVSGSDPLIISLAEGEAFTEANFGYGYLAAVQMAGFQALAGPGAVTLDWQVILTDPLPADFLVLRSGPTNSGLRVLTPQPVGPYNIQGQVAFYRFLDRTIAPGRTYRYWLEDHEGDRYGPWAVSLPGSQVFLPLVGLQHP